MEVNEAMKYFMKLSLILAFILSIVFNNTSTAATADISINQDKTMAYSGVIEDSGNTIGVSEYTLKDNGIEVDISSTSDKIFIKDYGIYALTKGENISANIDWNGNGSIMLLYTKEEIKTKDIEKFVEKGILPLTLNKTFSNGTDNVPYLSSNFTYVRQDKELKLNFVTTPNNLICWTNEVPETADYHIYLIATGDTGITNIQGVITLQ